MKKIMFLLVLLLSASLLLSGCSYYKAKQAQKDAEDQLAILQEKQAEAEEAAGQLEKATTTKTTTTTKTAAPTDDGDADWEEGEVRGVDAGDDGTVGLQKLGTQTRTKSSVEKCEMEYPFSCLSYIAYDGMVDITLKYLAYQGRLTKVTLSMDGQPCDPQGASIEPGLKQKFTCFTDESGDYASGDLEIEYFEGLKKMTLSNTGYVNVLWE